MFPNIVVVEDDPIIALDLVSFVRKLNYTHVYCCQTEYETRELLEELESAFVFLDINLDTKYGGISIAETLEARDKFAFAYITANTDHYTLQKLKHTHPIGFIVKPFKEEEVKVFLTLGAHNIKHPVVKPTVDSTLISRVLPALTTTEVRVFFELYKGASNHEIAENLFVSINTIKTHLKSIFSKLGVSSRLKAVQDFLDKL